MRSLKREKKGENFDDAYLSPGKKEERLLRFNKTEEVSSPCRERSGESRMNE